MFVSFWVLQPSPWDLRQRTNNPSQMPSPKRPSRSLMKRRYMHCMRRTPTNCWPGKWTSTEASRKLCQQQILAQQRLWPHVFLHPLNLTLKSDQKVSCLYLSLHVSFHLGPPPPRLHRRTCRGWHAMPSVRRITRHTHSPCGQIAKKFTNLDFPEIRGFPLLSYILGWGRGRLL